MDVLANNIANLSTVAFKGEQMVFADSDRGRRAARRVAYVEDAGTVRDWSQGPLTRTGNSLDVALQGEGFLEVETADRHPLHARRPAQARCPGAARHARRRSRARRSASVRSRCPPGSGAITIGQDGTISTPPGTVGQLAVVDFADLQSLVAEARRPVFDRSDARPARADTKVVQGMVEESNVQPILEMTRLMAAARAVGMAKTFQDGEADRHKNAIDRLAKVV